MDLEVEVAMVDDPVLNNNHSNTTPSFTSEKKNIFIK